MKKIVLSILALLILISCSHKSELEKFHESLIQNAENFVLVMNTQNNWIVWRDSIGVLRYRQYNKDAENVNLVLYSRIDSIPQTPIEDIITGFKEPLPLWDHYSLSGDSLAIILYPPQTDEYYKGILNPRILLTLNTPKKCFITSKASYDTTFNHKIRKSITNHNVYTFEDYQIYTDGRKKLSTDLDNLPIYLYNSDSLLYKYMGCLNYSQVEENTDALIAIEDIYNRIHRYSQKYDIKTNGFEDHFFAQAISEMKNYLDPDFLFPQKIYYPFSINEFVENLTTMSDQKILYVLQQVKSGRKTEKELIDMLIEKNFIIEDKLEAEKDAVDLYKAAMFSILF